MASGLNGYFAVNVLLKVLIIFSHFQNTLTFNKTTGAENSDFESHQSLKVRRFTFCHKINEKEVIDVDTNKYAVVGISR